MSILAAVFANARRIAFNVAGILECPVERRRKQFYEPGILIDESLRRSIEGSICTIRIGESRDDRPGLRIQVDLALGVIRATQGRAIVIIGT